jgi:hypothetical protein
MPKPYESAPGFIETYSAVLNPTDAAKAKGKVKGLKVTIDATHGGYVNRNFYFYTAGQPMQDSTESWTKPYNKPIIKNHNLTGGMFGGDASEPLGRVIKAEYIDQKDDRGFIRLTALITDEEAIQKIQDGRYLTVSVGSRPAGPVLCSICMKDLLKTGLCEHDRGEKYPIVNEEDEVIGYQTAHLIFDRLEYKECSIVGEPADNDGETAATITKWSLTDSVDAEMAAVNTDDTTTYTAVVDLATEDDFKELTSAADADADDEPSTEEPASTDDEPASTDDEPAGDASTEGDDEPSTDDEPAADASTDEPKEEDEDEPNEDALKQEADIQKLVDMLSKEIWR